MRNFDKTSDNEKIDEFAATKAALSAQDFLLTGDEDRANEELTTVDIITRGDLTGLAWTELGTDYHSDAEDVVQDVYLKFRGALSRGKFRGESKVETYLVRAVINKARDHIDKHKRQVLIDDENFFDYRITEDPYQEIEEQLAPSEATGLLRALSEHKKEALFLTAICGLSYVAISRITGKPQGSLKCYAHRAKKEIRERLGK